MDTPLRVQSSAVLVFCTCRQCLDCPWWPAGVVWTGAGEGPWRRLEGPLWWTCEKLFRRAQLTTKFKHNYTACQHIDLDDLSCPSVLVATCLHRHNLATQSTLLHSTRLQRSVPSASNFHIPRTPVWFAISIYGNPPQVSATRHDHHNFSSPLQETIPHLYTSI